MAREDRGAEERGSERRRVAVGRSVGGGWGGWQAGEADCTRCAVRLTACALRRRPTTLLFEKGVERDRGSGAEGRRVETEEDSTGEGKWRVWVAALTVAAIPEAPASASAARRESTEDETRAKERPRRKERQSATDRDGERGTRRKKDEAE